MLRRENSIHSNCSKARERCVDTLPILRVQELPVLEDFLPGHKVEITVIFVHTTKMMATGRVDHSCIRAVELDL